MPPATLALDLSSISAAAPTVPSGHSATSQPAFPALRHVRRSFAAFMAICAALILAGSTQSAHAKDSNRSTRPLLHDTNIQTPSIPDTNIGPSRTAGTHRSLRLAAVRCPPNLYEAGLCKRPSSRQPGSAPPTAPDRIICLNGRRSGRRCVCPRGTTLKRVSRRTYSCVIAPCPRGQKRVGRRCVTITPDPPKVRCINGRAVRGRCICLPPARPRRVSRNTYRCVIAPCPRGTRRKGRRCIPIVRPDPPVICPPHTHRVGSRCVRNPRPNPLPPRPTCKKGWVLKNGKCYRGTGTPTCPRGMTLKDGRCYRPRPPRPPPAAGGRAQLPAPKPTANTDGPYEPDQVLVEISGPGAQQTANRLIRTYGLVTLSRTQLTMLGTNLYLFRIPGGQTVQGVAAAITGEAGVETSQPNWRYRLNQRAPAVLPEAARARAPSAAHKTAPPPPQATRPTQAATKRAAPSATSAQDPSMPAQGAPAAAPKSNASTALPQYAPAMIKAQKAHRISRGENVLIAVIDTGIDGKHPELEGTISAHFNAFPSQPLTPDKHATAIAGILTAKRDLAGISPAARILAVQAFTPTSSDKDSGSGGNGTSQRIAVSINWAMMKGARVINMSFAGPSMDDLVARLIARGNEAGIIFVAAAGNGGPKAKPAFPAAHAGVISVTAVDDTQKLYDHANIGDYIDVSAPGVDIMSPAPGGAYDIASGTSFAAAHVSAVAALVLARSPRTNRDKLLSQLKTTAFDLGPPGPDNQYGAGLVDALGALSERALQTSRP